MSFTTPGQRIPLRAVRDTQAPNSGISGGSRAGSPVGPHLNQVLVGNDCVTLTYQIAGAVSSGYTNDIIMPFPNLPVTSSSATSPYPVVSVGNQNQQATYTAPQGTILEFYTWSVVTAVPSVNKDPSNPGTLYPQLLVSSYARPRAIEQGGVVHSNGQHRLPSGVTFTSFGFVGGLTFTLISGATAPTTGFYINVDVYGILVLTYPSGNAS